MAGRKGTIFINYRKDDSNWNALALYQELQKYFSKDQLFKDFNAISPGDDFVISINNALQSCDVLLVLIGKEWLEIKDETGARRLSDPHDFVRLEISKALERNIKVVPVLLDRTPMPKASELPDNLQALCRRQFVEIDPTRFEDDVRKLAEAIRKVMDGSGLENSGPARPEPTPTPQPAWQQPDSPTPGGGGYSAPPPKPNNNLVWGILTTIACCLPLGIVSIVQASKVDSLYAQRQYKEAEEAAANAKKYAMWAGIAGGCFWVLYFVYFLILGMNGGGY